MDRRSLLKSAAALRPYSPTAAAVAATEPAALAPLVQPVKASPYASYVWEWFVSHDGETYYEGFPTKEEAIKYAQQSEYSLVAECRQQDFRLDISGDWIVERLNEDNYELIGEGDGIDCTSAQQADLERMVGRAIEAWVVKHGINITAWSFEETKNQTEIAAVTNGELTK